MSYTLKDFEEYLKKINPGKYDNNESNIYPAVGKAATSKLSSTALKVPTQSDTVRPWDVDQMENPFYTGGQKSGIISQDNGANGIIGNTQTPQYGTNTNNSNNDPYAIPWMPEQQASKRLSDLKTQRENFNQTFVGIPTTEELMKLSAYDNQIAKLQGQLGIGNATNTQNAAAPLGLGFTDDVVNREQEIADQAKPSVPTMTEPIPEYSQPEKPSIPTMTEPIKRYSQPEPLVPEMSEPIHRYSQPAPKVPEMTEPIPAYEWPETTPTRNAPSVPADTEMPEFELYGSTNASGADGGYIKLYDDIPAMEDIEAKYQEAQAGNETQVAPYVAGPMVEDTIPPYTPGPSTGSNNPPYTPGQRWEDESFPYERNIEVKAVVFYEPDGSKKDAKDEKKYLEEKGYVVLLVPVTNGLSFANKWNYMPESVGHVTVISHSHPWALTFNKSSDIGVSVKNSDYRDDKRSKDDIYVEDLLPKEVSLRLMGCNTGHKDVSTNLAYAFSKIVTGDVWAADGNLKSGWLIFKANHGNAWDYAGSKSFYHYVPEWRDREPEGIYKYE